MFQVKTLNEAPSLTDMHTYFTKTRMGITHRLKKQLVVVTKLDNLLLVVLTCQSLQYLVLSTVTLRPTRTLFACGKLSSVTSLTALKSSLTSSSHPVKRSGMSKTVSLSSFLTVLMAKDPNTQALELKDSFN